MMKGKMFRFFGKPAINRKKYLSQSLKQLLIFLILLTFICYNSVSAREYIHIFTSKGVYETCEDLWFKCVVLDGTTMCISDNSNTAYMEIIDPSDSVVWREKYRLTNGMCDGHAYVGPDWKSGEYRMFVYTKRSLGRSDTILYPKRLLIVRELPEVSNFLDAAKNRTSCFEVPNGLKENELMVSVTMDSAQYHPRSKIKAVVRVSNQEGTPVRAIIAMSVFDVLYSYAPADVDIHSHIYGLSNMRHGGDSVFDPFLSDGVASGHLSCTKRKNNIPLEGQYINIFDETAEKGALNIIATGREGCFEIPSDIGSSLGSKIIIKPLCEEEVKAKIEFDNPFDDISEIRSRAIEMDFPLIEKDIRNYESFNDAVPYTERHTVRLDELVVSGKGRIFPKRNKVMGYLDSIVSSWKRAWVCCGVIRNGEYLGGFINDYLNGYTHHPEGDPYYYLHPPKNVRPPENGKMYYTISHKWSSKYGCFIVADQGRIQYKGPIYSDEELLEMTGFWRTKGYYPKRRFRLPSVDDLSEDIEDSRNTLLWLPRAQTNDNGEFSIEFPASDIKSTFKVSVLILMPDMSISKNCHEYFTVM